MFMKKIFCFISLFTFSIYSISQTELFLDENLKTISKKDYNLKSNSFLFITSKKTVNNTNINYLDKMFEFGKFDSIQNLQLRNIISRELDNNIIGKPLLIEFKQQIYNVEKKIALSKEGIPTEKGIARIKRNYLINRKTFDSNQKKCLKKIKNTDYYKLDLYGENYNYVYKSKHIKYIKSPQILLNLFFKRKIGGLVIQPNGTYFYYYASNQKAIIKLLETDNWTRFISSYKANLKSLTPIKNGFLAECLTPFETHYYTYKKTSKTQSNSRFIAVKHHLFNCFSNSYF